MNWLRTFKNSHEPTYSEDAIGLAVHEDRFNWIICTRDNGNIRVTSHGSVPLAQGIIENGEVRDPAALARELIAVKEMFGDRHVHVSFPSHHTIVFTMHIPFGIPSEQVRNMITFEMETRIPGRRFDDMAIEYEVLAESPSGQELVVVLYPHRIEQEYEKAFTQADIHIASFEPSMRSVARALSTNERDGVLHAIADVGSKETSLYVLRNGVPVVLSHVPHDQTHTQEIAEDAIRRLHQWDARRDSHNARITPIGRVHVVGPYAHHPAYADLGSDLGKGVHIAANYGNVWQRLFSFDDYIPPIDRVSSTEYAAAIGLALRGLLDE